MQLTLKHRIQFAACEGLRPLLRRLPAARVRLLGWFGGGQNNTAWAAHPRRHQVFWDADLRAWIEVDLADWGGRWHYFSGRYYDQLVPWIMKQYLRPGDTFVDVGANFGIHSLRASRIVGEAGKVFALEPSPPALRRLQLHLLLNRAENAEVLPLAVASEEGESVLHVDPAHLGTASLRQDFSGSTEIGVRITTLDVCVTQPDSKGRVLIKIDVEGFELDAIRGACGWLERPNTIFVVEVTPEWIKSTGGEPDELFDAFHRTGFKGFQIARGGFRFDAAPIFIGVDRPAEGQADYLFAREDELKDLAWVNIRPQNEE